MKIIIVGCGKVGYTLAEQLSEEGHEITVIERDEEKLTALDETLDVIGVLGNGSSYRMQLEAGIEKADLFISVTGQDELNLLCCLIARKAGNCRTIARVRNPEYYKEITFIKEELGLSLAINPELVAAADAFHLIQIPSAMEINSFAKGRVNMVRFAIPKKSSWHDLPISEIASRYGNDFLIGFIEREHAVIIPNGDTKLFEGDILSVIMETKALNNLFVQAGIASKKVKKVMIVGGGTIAYYLARQLLQGKVEVKIIENNRSRCDELSDLLPHAMIIHADATNEAILKEEGIEHMDAFVSLTNLDEENIMLALYANKMSKAKVITKINRIGFEGVINDIPIGSIISPKYLTAERIIQYVRSRESSYGSAVEAVYRMADNQVEALEFLVKTKSKVTEIPLMELSIKRDILIGNIIRGKRVIIPTGHDMIEIGDIVIVVTTEKGLDDLEDILA